LSDFCAGGDILLECRVPTPTSTSNCCKSTRNLARTSLFTALVEGHIDLVFSAALRQVHSQELAQEVTQSVFIELARQKESRCVVWSTLAPTSVYPKWISSAIAPGWTSPETQTSIQKKAFAALLPNSAASPKTHSPWSFPTLFSNISNDYEGQLPARIAELKPLFKLPVTDAMPNQYEKTHTGKYADVPKGDYVISEKRVSIPNMTASGASGRAATVMTTRAKRRMTRLLRKCSTPNRAANDGRTPSTREDLLPYIKTPRPEAGLSPTHRGAQRQEQHEPDGEIIQLNGVVNRRAITAHFTS
jgi:hypothetical protein